jgi:endo-1,4-beta-xylanase
MKFTSAIVGAILASPFVSGVPTEIVDRASNKDKYHGLGLNSMAKRAGLLYFGTAVDNPSFNNSKYLSIAFDKNEFGQVTPANGQKYMYIEPERNVFNYTLGDQVIKTSIKSGKCIESRLIYLYNCMS